VKKIIGLGALTLSASVAGWSSEAEAQVACSGLDNPVVVSGSTAVQPYLAKVAVALAGGTGDKKISVVLKASGSCSGVAQLAADTASTCTAEACVTGTASYWTAGGDPTKPSQCNLDSAGQHIDLILSDVYKESCEGVTGADALLDETFAVIPFAFITPKASSQNAIDAREAYYAYGKGPTGNVTPWVNKDVLFQRNSGSGTQITVFKGTDATSGGKMLTNVAAATDVEAALGFAALDAVDAKRDTLNVLAYRHYKEGSYKQNSYYYPDSTSSSYDKKNVRDGHYPLWGYEHLVRRSANTAAKKLADVLTQVTALPGSKDVTQLEVESFLVPKCAMKVQRTADAGDFSVYKPEASCGCYFEKNVTDGTTACTECTKDGDCAGTETCNLGYCEAK